MPILNPDRRAANNRRHETYERIKDTFKNKQWTSQHCRLCNWASNGLTLEEAVHVNQEHERLHAEYVEYEASLGNIEDTLAAIHDHECQFANCICKCGCRKSAGCALVFGPLCSVCHVREMRGDSEHGKEAPDA